MNLRIRRMCVVAAVSALVAAGALGQQGPAGQGSPALQQQAGDGGPALQRGIEESLEIYRGQLEAARSDIEQARVYYRMGSELLVVNRTAEAARAFESAFEVGDATLAIGILNQASSALFRTREYDALIGLCRAALKHHTGNEYVEAPALFYSGRAYEMQGESAKAIAEYEALLERCPESPYRLQTAQLLANLQVATGDFSAAEGVVRRELERDPSNVTLGLRLVVILEQRGDIVSATEECERLLSEEPTAEAVAQKLYQLKKQHGGLDEYIAELRKALEARPTDLAVRQRLANVYMSEKQYAEAIAQHEILLEATPDDVALHQRTAWLHQQEGSLQQAKEHYGRALALQPQNVSLYSPLGDVYMRLGDDAAAVDAWKRGTAYQPNDPSAVVRFGQLLYARSRYDLALQTYAEARELLGDEALFAQQMAAAHEALLDFEGAIEEYLRAAVAASTETDPIPPAASSAAELAESEDKLAFLIERAEALLEEHPDNTALVAVLVRAHTHTGDSQRAAELLAEDGQAVRAPTGFLLRLAETLLEQGEPEAAGKLFARARESADDGGWLVEAAMGLAQARARQRQWESAAEALEQALAASATGRSDTRVLFELADIYLQHLRRIDRARELYEDIPVHDSATGLRAEMGIANCLFALGEYEEAAERYRALPAVQPRHFAEPPAPPFLHGVPPPLLPWPMPPATPDRRAEYMVAECAFRSGDLERAADMFEGLAQNAPGSAEANDGLRRLALIRGDMTVDPDGAELYLAGLNARERGAYDRARDDLDEVMEKRPRGPLADDALMLLADILAEEGRIEEARNAYDRLVASQPSSPLRPEGMFAAGRLCEERLADADGAATYYDRVLREYPRSPVAAQARIRLDDMKRGR